MSIEKLECLDCFGSGFKIRIPEKHKSETTKCGTCGGTGTYKKGEKPFESEYKKVPYTIQTDFDSGVVWLNNYLSKERIAITEKDSRSIANGLKLIKARKKGLI